MHRLKELIEKSGVKQKEHAKILGIGEGLFSNIVNGNRDIPKRKVKEIAEYFNVSIGYLLGYDEELLVEEKMPNSSILINSNDISKILLAITESNQSLSKSNETLSTTNDKLVDSLTLLIEKIKI